jgi:hypothetical protein
VCDVEPNRRFSHAKGLICGEVSDQKRLLFSSTSMDWLYLASKYEGSQCRKDSADLGAQVQRTSRKRHWDGNLSKLEIVSIANYHVDQHYPQE